ncbi:ABC transporter substrate-binding protein [Taibaiella koreensis]|uniref:ABC transporter substrate-binding protein n=1 Tax=Taibaiella koreensis TaxID=1268548 RepID=UPI000E59DDE8|nr:ABC transporter substrate-binding protein [Taibaiella koreensis]
MEKKIGILLPRSTDYPAMGFDLLDGLRCRLKYDNLEAIKTIPENIGFGEDRKVIYAKAEKLLLQDEADCVIAYLTPANAASLYPLFDAAGKTLIVLDPGMNYPDAAPGKRALHISLQGLHANYLSGRKAAESAKGVILATSFYDGGYGGPNAHARGAEEGGSAVVHNFVSHYKESEFSVQPFIKAVREEQNAPVLACFSTYLASLFLNGLSAEQLPGDMAFHCSAFMAEEQTMATYTLPDARFYAYIPWASVLERDSNKAFIDFVAEQKGKTANVFHLLGWEAGIICAQLLAGAGKQEDAVMEMLQEGWSYESPRGAITFHPQTQTAYGPLYFAEMLNDSNKKAALKIHDEVAVAPDEHLKVLQDRPQGITSGWFNNYLCT